MFRIGFGYDSHRLVTDRKLVIGGVHIPSDKGSLGHSDGDALIHAICDALLGSLALGDIGTHFPDNSDEFKDIDSRILLERTIELVREPGWEIANIDSTVCLEQPKLKPHIPMMVKTLAGLMGIDENQLSIKATTNEKMGFVGREEGIAAYAAALVMKSS